MKRFHVHAHVDDLQAGIPVSSGRSEAARSAPAKDAAACCASAVPRGNPVGIAVKPLASYPASPCC
jgi:hypothetical protein